MSSYSDFTLQFLHHPYPFSIGTQLAVKLCDESGFVRAAGKIVVTESHWRRELNGIYCTDVGFKVFGRFWLEGAEDEMAFQTHCQAGRLDPTAEARTHFMAGLKASRKAAGK